MKTYIHLGHRKLEAITPVVNEPIIDGYRRSRNKPYKGGLWASEYTPDSESRSVWEAWCIAENFADYGKDDYFLFTFMPSAKILTIRDRFDYDSLPEKYLDEKGYLDWEAIEKEYDAVEVTKSHGYWIQFEWFAPVQRLEGWDVPSIVVFHNDAIKEIKKS